MSGKEWMAALDDVDTHLSSRGRVMELLSEHLCQGWLEGYLLTGRDGLFSCYEASIHIVDSMVNQHAKWKATASYWSTMERHRLHVGAHGEDRPEVRDWLTP